MRASRRISVASYLYSVLLNHSVEIKRECRMVSSRQHKPKYQQCKPEMRRAESNFVQKKVQRVYFKNDKEPSSSECP